MHLYHLQFWSVAFEVHPLFGYCTRHKFQYQPCHPKYHQLMTILLSLTIQYYLKESDLDKYSQAIIMTVK